MSGQALVILTGDKNSLAGVGQGRLGDRMSGVS